MTSPLSPPQTGGRRGESTRSARFIASARSQNVISRLPALKTRPPIDPGPIECPSLLVEAEGAALLVEARLISLAQKKNLGEGLFGLREIPP
jgi:hypothetical protein